jgi:hypothetical protein
MRSASKLRRSGCFTALALLFLCTSPTSSGQAVNPPSGPPKQAEQYIASFAGCYELVLGKWWPFSFGEDTIFVTPPARIKLLPERGTKGFEENGFLIRAISPWTSPSTARVTWSFWEVKSKSRIDLTWTNGLSGVTLTLKKNSPNLRGWAHPHFDFPTPPPRIQRVTAKQIPCQPDR